MLNIFGGKITTLRELAEREYIGPLIFPTDGEDWAESVALPGGGIENADYDAFSDKLKTDYP